MSTDYRTMEKISFADLFDGRLERFEIREHINAGSTSNIYRCLTDGRNYLWAYADDNGNLAGMSRYGANAPGRILQAARR